MPFALEMCDLTKCFGKKAAVDRLTLQLETGQFLGLLGRNGAGKSTTIRMATGLLTPTEGSIRVLGLDLAQDSVGVKRQIGVMPEDMALLEYLTGPQYLHFTGRMYGLADEAIAARTRELMSLLDLQPGPRTLIADFSSGMKKKLAFCAAILHNPRLLFLDEPFEGIDAVTSQTIKGILLSLRAHGVTMILTSHILDIVEKLCPLVAILDEGRLKGFGALEELRMRSASENLEALFLDLVGGSRKGELSWL